MVSEMADQKENKETSKVADATSSSDDHRPEPAHGDIAYRLMEAYYDLGSELARIGKDRS